MINSMSILGFAYIWYIVQLNKYFAEINKKTKQNKTQIYMRVHFSYLVQAPQYTVAELNYIYSPKIINTKWFGYKWLSKDQGVGV